MRSIIWFFAVLGILLPVAVMTVDRVSLHGWWPRWVFFVWQTSYMLIANEGVMNARAYAITAVSVGLMHFFTC